MYGRPFLSRVTRYVHGWPLESERLVFLVMETPTGEGPVSPGFPMRIPDIFTCLPAWLAGLKSVTGRWLIISDFRDGEKEDEFSAVHL